MGRPIYPYELGDPDFSWLISSFRENNPSWSLIEISCLPMVFIKDREPLATEEHIVPAEALKSPSSPEAAKSKQ